jgi:large subunit ribosomal protein L15
MKLNELSSIKKKTKRVGRGGKRGTTSGRGTKGQKSRSGHRMRPAERDLILRIPKARGFRNKPQEVAAIIFNVGFLSDRLKRDGHEKGVVLTKEFLIAMKLLPARFQGLVKVLGHGDVTTSFSVKGLKLSKEAAQKIEKAGGKISQ